MADSFDVIMAAYPSTGLAERDFDALVRLVKDKAVTSEGVILAERNADGQVRVTQTGDHLGRKGLGWGGGVGLLVGLLSPPMLASIAVGGAVGSLVGKFASTRWTAASKRASVTSCSRAPRSSSRWSTTTTDWRPSRR
jgi:arylsulfatase